MKALVTGATGFVGQPPRRGAAAPGRSRSRRWSARPRKAEALEPLGVRVVPGDLDDAGSLARAVEGQDVVFHVAGLVAAQDEASSCASTATARRAWSRPPPRRERAVASSRLLDGRRLVRPAPGRRSPAREPAATGDRRTAGASSRRETAVTASALPWVDRATADGLRPPRREVLKVFRMARLGRRPGVRRRQPGALGGARRRPGERAGRRGDAQPRRSARSTTPAIRRSSTSAEFVRAVGARDGAAASASCPIPHAVGRALLALTEAGAATRRADDDPHPGQGQRVLPAGLDRRPGAAHPGLGLARRARPGLGHG